MYHAYPNGFHTLGRVSIIEPIEWTEDGWYKSADSSNMRPLFCDMDLSDNFRGGRYGWQWTNWKLSRRSPLNKDMNLWLATAQDKSYCAKVKVNIKNGAAGMLLFYEERAFAGLVADTENITTYVGSGKSVESKNIFGKRFSLRITNRENKVEIAVRKAFSFKWVVLGSDIDVSGMHHNNYAGFFALRIGLISADTFPCAFRRFRYEPLGD